MSKEIIEERRRAYSRFFEPAYIKMERIHTDYLHSFHIFYELALRRETPNISLFQELKEYSIEYAAWRQDVRDFSFIARKLIENFDSSEEKNAIRAFSRAIRNYFKVAPVLERKYCSWYSYFLLRFKRNIIDGMNPFEDDYTKFIAGGDPLEDFLMFLEIAYTKEIPSRWSSVVRAKTRLQGLFDI